MSQARSALIIATDNYEDPRLASLRAPVKDAHALERVLGDPAIGDFDVQVAINQPEARLRRDLGRFFGDRGRIDLLLVYISCHGIKDEDGRLYFAATDSDLQNLSATCISADFLNDLMTKSRSQVVVLVLDCCYSGAFPSGMGIKGPDEMNIGDRFAGRGRIVITSSGRMEYSFEGDTSMSGNGVSSIFADAFVHGLETGDADLDRDGWVTADELFSYLYDEIRSRTPNQTPSRIVHDLAGPVIIARNPTIETAVSAETIALSRNYSEKPTPEESKAAPIAATSPQQTEPAAFTAEKQYAAEPIAANDYWTIKDQLDYKPYAIAISEFIQNKGTAPPLTIGIKAPWGAGKTSLMRMVRDLLDPPLSADSSTTVGAERRQRVALTEASWLQIVGRPHWRRLLLTHGDRNAKPAEVTNLTLSRKLKHQEKRTRKKLNTADPNFVTRNLEIKQPNPVWRPTVWFSPWMYQGAEQVWAGLAHEIISQLTGRMSLGEREGFWLELNFRRVDADALRRRLHRALLERLLPLVGGLTIIALLSAMLFLFHFIFHDLHYYFTLAAQGVLAAGAAGTALLGLLRISLFWKEPVAGSLTALIRQPDYIKNLQQATAKESDGIFSGLASDPGYESRLGYLHLVQEDMRRVLDLVATGDRPVVVLVDDLDRCSPGTVAQVIEAINLFLAGQFPNCIFIVAMEPELVAAHIEVIYKPLVDTLGDDDYWGEARTLGWRFLDKIVQLPISLPALRSDQVSRFLGIALANSQAEATTPDSSLDATRIRRIEEGIRQQNPSIENISTTASAAEDQLSEAESGRFLSGEAQEAMRRELRRRLRPEDPEVQRIVALTAGRLARNPREIKRFVNVFRFYAVIRQEREAVDLPAPDTLAEIAKLAVLAVRWPHLRSALGRQVGMTERDTLLSLLETTIAEFDDNTNWVTKRQELHRALGDLQIPERLLTNLITSDGLCEFLASAPPIGTAAPGYL